MGPADPGARDANIQPKFPGCRHDAAGPVKDGMELFLLRLRVLHMRPILAASAHFWPVLLLMPSSLAARRQFPGDPTAVRTPPRWGNGCGIVADALRQSQLTAQISPFSFEENLFSRSKEELISDGDPMGLHLRIIGGVATVRARTRRTVDQFCRPPVSLKLPLTVRE